MPANYSHCRGLPQFVYVMGSWSSGAVKVGITADLQARRSMLQVGYPERLDILWFTAGGRALEHELHTRLSAHRSIGEWFKFDDAQTALTSVIAAAVKILTAPPAQSAQRKTAPAKQRPVTPAQAPQSIPSVDVLEVLLRFPSGATPSRIARAARCSESALYPCLHELRARGLAQVINTRNWWTATENVTTADLNEDASP